jgi:hypothetical protein
VSRGLLVERSEESTHLPRPEEPILRGVHGGKGELLDAGLDSVIPGAGDEPQRAVSAGTDRESGENQARRSDLKVQVKHIRQR